MSSALDQTLTKQTASETTQKALGNVYTVVIAIYVLWIVNNSADLDLLQFIKITFAALVLPMSVYLAAQAYLQPVSSRSVMSDTLSVPSPSMSSVSTRSPSTSTPRSLMSRPESQASTIKRSQSTPRELHTPSNTSSNSPRCALQHSTSTMSKLSKIARHPLEKRRSLIKRNTSPTGTSLRSNSPCPSISPVDTLIYRPPVVARNSDPEHSSRGICVAVRKGDGVHTECKDVSALAANITGEEISFPHVSKVSKIKRMFSFRKHKSGRRSSV